VPPPLAWLLALPAEAFDEPPAPAPPAARTGLATINVAAKTMKWVDMAAYRDDVVSEFYSRMAGRSNASQALFLQAFCAMLRGGV
jgi:hypothetical protein